MMPEKRDKLEAYNGKGRSIFDIHYDRKNVLNGIRDFVGSRFPGMGSVRDDENIKPRSQETREDHAQRLKRPINYSEELHRAQNRRQAIEKQQNELEAEYRAKQERDWAFRLEIERADSIENAFFREFGLVERLGEIQKCLATAVYTGEISIDVIDTQLINIERMIGQLHVWTPPERGEGTTFHIPGLNAMETAGDYLENRLKEPANSEQLSEALRNYFAALEVVEESIKRVRESLKSRDIEVRIEAERARKVHWEEELAILEQLMPGAVAELNEEELLAVAQRLAEYAAERFRDRL